MNKENSSFIDEFFSALVAELQEELGIAMFKDMKKGMKANKRRI